MADADAHKDVAVPESQSSNSAKLDAVLHELRTPLTSVRGALGLMIGGVAGPLPDDARELLRVAERNIERLSQLVDELLAMDHGSVDRDEPALRARPTSD